MPMRSGLEPRSCGIGYGVGGLTWQASASGGGNYFLITPYHFVRKDGQIAFTIPSELYDRSRLNALITYLGLPVETAGLER